jgi:pimeloyl-ACP methyl ester carboxylesterase
VVAFRGTEPQEQSDIRQDARFWPTAWDGGGEVHTGFAESLALIRREFLAALQGASGRLLLTGHSLGAAIATLAATLVPADRRGDTLLCTFGSPRVGCEKFGDSLAGLTHLRYAGACDLVSWVPPVELVPYRHHGILRCLDRAGAEHEFHAGESAHAQAAALRAEGCSRASVAEIFLKLIARRVPVRELSDHAPINYMSAVWRIRA